MNVKELIKALQKIENQDLPVIVMDSFHDYVEVTGVGISEGRYYFPSDYDRPNTTDAVTFDY